MNKIFSFSFSLVILLSLNSLHAAVTTITSQSQFKSIVLNSKKPVVVKVFAPWCGPCRNSTQPFEELSQGFSSLTFATVNIDENGFIRNYANSLPTFLVFKDGKVIAKDEGFESKGKWASIITRATGIEIDGKKKPALQVADQADAQQQNNNIAKGSACLAGQGYLANAYNAVRDFLVNIGNTVKSWFR